MGNGASRVKDKRRQHSAPHADNTSISTSSRPHYHNVGVKPRPSPVTAAAPPSQPLSRLPSLGVDAVSNTDVHHTQRTDASNGTSANVVSRAPKQSIMVTGGSSGLHHRQGTSSDGDGDDGARAATRGAAGSMHARMTQAENINGDEEELNSRPFHAARVARVPTKACLRPPKAATCAVGDSTEDDDDDDDDDDDKNNNSSDKGEYDSDAYEYL